MIHPQHLIARLRLLIPNAVPLYTEGHCLGFHEFLKQIYPSAKGWYDPIDCHAYTEIGGKFYDITGEAKFQSYWRPLSRQQKRRLNKRWLST
jgi:hypothetical protein